MDKGQVETRILIVLAATERAIAWDGASRVEIAKALVSMDHGEISASALDGLLSAARRAGLLEFRAVFGWRCWNLTKAGRVALTAGRVDLA